MMFGSTRDAPPRVCVRLTEVLVLWSCRRFFQDKLSDWNRCARRATHRAKRALRPCCPFAKNKTSVLCVIMHNLLNKTFWRAAFARKVLEVDRLDCAGSYHARCVGRAVRRNLHDDTGRRVCTKTQQSLHARARVVARLGVAVVIDFATFPNLSASYRSVALRA